MENKIKRFERKWVFKNNNSLVLVNSLIRSNLFFRPQYPLRKVNSIYFDTHDYESIRQNLDGISNKKKIRIRWYGNQDIISNPVIEIKSKKEFETRKESVEIKDLNNLKFSSIGNLEIIKEKLNIKLKTKKTIFPILTTHYTREYFISLNGKIRATVDYKLKSVFLNNLSQTDVIKNFKDICILELKYPTYLDNYVRQNLNNSTFRLSKNSKFVNSAFERPKSFS